MAPPTQNPSTAGKGSIGMTTTNNKILSSFSSSLSPAAESARTGPISQTAEIKKITGTSDDLLRKLTMKQLGRLLKSYGMAPKKLDTLTRWDRVYVIRDFSTKAASDGIGDGLKRFARGEKMKRSEQSSSNSHNTNKRRRLSNNADHDDHHHDEDDHDTKIDEKNFKATAVAADAIATTTTTDGTILTVSCTIQTLQSLITGAVETALRQSEHRHAVALQQALQESEQRHADALRKALQESEQRSDTALKHQSTRNKEELQQCEISALLRDEVFGGRVSDAVHISNNERKIAKYNSESNVAKYNSESNVAKYNSESNVAKYNCKSNVDIAKYNCESNVATAKYNCESNVATAKYNCESKIAIQCTMMRSDYPVDADTQERVLEVTRLMNTSSSSLNRSQSNQPYQYPPTPLPYPPYMRFLPYPPQYEFSSYPLSQYESAPYRSNGQHGAMASPSPPYKLSNYGSVPHYSPYQHGG